MKLSTKVVPSRGFYSGLENQTLYLNSKKKIKTVQENNLYYSHFCIKKKKKFPFP